MPFLLPSIISSKSPQPLLLLQSTAAQSCLPLLRDVVEKSLLKRTVILCCFLHPPSAFVDSDQLQSSNLRLLDWTAKVPGYCADWTNPSEDISKIMSNCNGVTVDIIIDSVDTLLSDLGSQSETYKILSNILASINVIAVSSSSRLIAHVHSPCPLIPLLTDTRLSSSLVHLKAHSPALLTHISKAYLTLPLPQSSPEKFWSVFTPLSERHRECEKLIYGSDGDGTGGDEIVVELIVRSAGGSGRRRGVERFLEGWTPRSTGGCELQALESLRALWSNKTVTHEAAPDPTNAVSFNLNLTPEQQQSRAQVALPYAHEGIPSNSTTPAAILYDPDSADDIDDDDPDEDLDL